MWQLSRPAIVARETTARLVGPAVSAVIGGPRVIGREHLDGIEPPFLICPNHTSHLDVSTLRLALGPHLRRRLAAAAADDYFFARRRFRSFIAAWLGGVAFRRGVSPESIAGVERLLAGGWGVILFPEGTRSRSGELASFKPGVGLLATRTGVPVVPVRIDGLHAILPPGQVRPRRGHVEVRFGAPLRALPDEDARAFTARLETAVRSL
jgi:1-acyl-sn-glycerol-3-phosphate acyltransferase